jgi:hypothetical protein
MGRKRKFRWGDVVYRHRGVQEPYYGVVVDQYTDEARNSYYYLVRTDKYGKYPTWGHWVETRYLEPSISDGGWRRNRSGLVMPYRWNMRHPDRGCNCHCCGHERQH